MNKTEENNYIIPSLCIIFLIMFTAIMVGYEKNSGYGKVCERMRDDGSSCLEYSWGPIKKDIGTKQNLTDPGDSSKVILRTQKQR